MKYSISHISEGGRLCKYFSFFVSFFTELSRMNEFQFTEGRIRLLMKWDEANSGAYGQMFSDKVGWKLRSTRGIKEFGENEN